MLVSLTLALALQQVTVRVGTAKPPTAADSARTAATRDSIRFKRLERRLDRERRPPRRTALTPELERNAFADATARTLLLHARQARLGQDAALVSYDARAYQRLSLGLGVRAVGRERLFFRSESVSRVRWSRASGVHIEVLGARSVTPSAGGVSATTEPDETLPVPYFPGREALWLGWGTTRAEVDERELVHPLALGAEAYYRYAAGDSLALTLSDGMVIRLRELRIAPRRAEWKLAVGSFWFDEASGQLVRAAYRLAAPVDIWKMLGDDAKQRNESAAARGERNRDAEAPPAWFRWVASPAEARLEAVTIEYGLFGGRFWLPRVQYAEAWARGSVVRLPIRMEERFTYASVNGGDSLPAIPAILTRRELRDSLFADSALWSELSESQRGARIAALVHADSSHRMQRRDRLVAECAATGYTTRIDERSEGVRSAVRIPCDTSRLTRPDVFPAPIFDADDLGPDAAGREALLKGLGYSLQSEWGAASPRWELGPGQLRYNRVEGLSLGAAVSQQLGRGLAWDASARLGLADREPNGTLGLSRTNGRSTWRLSLYKSLSVANDDWGAPLSTAASMGALLFGRDEGYYLRARGVQLTNGRDAGAGLTTRLFVERQGAASRSTRFNVSRALGGGSEFLENITAQRATLAGLALRDRRSTGADPHGLRLSTEVRVEGGWATIDSAAASWSRRYLRAAGEATVSHALGERLLGAITLGAGASTGAPLPQRAFFLGGAHTVRGQPLGSMSGDAYWLARGELALAAGAVRPTVFWDQGWAGARSAWNHPGRPLAGAGAGLSLLDGLVRLDLSRGSYPRQGYRLDLYLDARF
ncbi:MAG: ShlB/FhaC/HecB family hemolysin secretion/activation protein [Gemmatimonadaceae bacterium]